MNTERTAYTGAPLRWALSCTLLLSSCAAPATESRCGTNGVQAVAGFDGVDLLLESCVEDGAFPGAVLAVGSSDSMLYVTAAGHYGIDDPRPVGENTVYDLASLTKVIGLTTATMLLASEGYLDLDQRLSEFFPKMRGTPKGDVTIRHLLTHTSGLAAWRPLHLETETRAEAIDSVLAAGLESTPGAAYTYSDLGAIALGFIVEQIAREGLDEFLQRRVFGPLGMASTRYRPPAQWIDRIAPTEDDPWRGRVIRGEVHDENAARLGGVAGHAGLFSTATDLALFAQWILKAYHGRLDSTASVRIPSEIVRNFVTLQPGPEGSTRALGWDTPSEAGSSAGNLLSRNSFGHTGFTGTSIWIDPERDLFVILLSNRVHPTRNNGAMSWVRPAVADAVVRAATLGGRAERR